MSARFAPTASENQSARRILSRRTFKRSKPMREALQPIIEKVWRHCEQTGTRGRTVTLKVKFADFEQITRSRSV